MITTLRRRPNTVAALELTVGTLDIARTMVTTRSARPECKRYILAMLADGAAALDLDRNPYWLVHDGINFELMFSAELFSGYERAPTPEDLRAWKQWDEEGR